MEKSEDNLIAWIANRAAAGAGGAAADGVVGIGDDMAILRIGDETLLTAADMLMDGVHFDSRVHSPRQIGRKALAVNLSDCAAMAVRPWCALVSVALPDDWPMERAKELMDGVIELADAFECRVVGGDTNSWAKPLAIDVTILARPYDGIAPVQRRNAKPGDSIYVTGRLGGSLESHQMTFTPRVHEAYQLATILGEDLHAMMDLSDGLSTDATRMAKASNVGMEFDATELVDLASPTARTHAASDEDRLLSVLNDGEDFELLFTVAENRSEGVPDKVRDATLPEKRGTEISFVGTVIADPGVRILMPDGSRKEIHPKGWQHFQ